MTYFGTFEKAVDLSVCRRGPGILIKMSTTVDLSVYAAWLRGPDISQNIQQRFKKYPKIDCRAFAFNRRRYTADNRLDLFGLSKFKGAMPPCPPPLIQISLKRVLYERPYMAYMLYDAPMQSGPAQFAISPQGGSSELWKASWSLKACK